MKILKKEILILLALLALLPVGANAKEALTLKDAIVIGLKNNFDIEISKKSVMIAQQQNSWGMAGGLPTLTLNGNLAATAELISPTSTTTYGGVSADLAWTLFDGFNIKATKRILENGEEIAEGTEMITVENTIHSIITSYYYVLLQQEVLKINEIVLNISNDRLSQQEISKEIGAGGNYEYIQAKSDYLSDKSSYIKQQMTLRDAVRSLNLLLSLPANTELELIQEIEIPEYNYSEDDMREKMLSDNKSLKNQYIYLKTKEYEIKQSRSSLYPSIGLYGSIGAGSSSFATAPSSNYIQPTIGLSVSFNLFNGGKIKRNNSIARFSMEAEQVSTDQMVHEMNSELASQIDGYNIYRTVVDYNTQQLEVATMLLKLSEEKSKNGSIDSFDFREVQLSYLQSANERLNSIYNLIVINADLLKITGGIISAYSE